MHTLFLNLASHDGAVAVVSEDRVLAFALANHRLNDSELLPLIEGVLKQSGKAYPDLTGIACIIGPGGFMSIRSAVACANALSFALKIPVAGVHASDLYRARIAGVTEPQLKGNVWWVHSTKKEQLFVRGFGAAEKAVPESTLKTTEEASALFSEKDLWMGELIPEQRAVFAPKNLQEAELQSLESVLPAFLAAQKYEQKLLEPWYGRGW